MAETGNGNVIETIGLVKHYGKTRAVDGVSLNVKKGEIYGFIGLNGAGKTTTIRMLLGMIRPMSGEVSVCSTRILPGKPGPWEKVGYLVEMPYSYPDLTVMENISTICRLRGLKNRDAAKTIISQLKLDEYANVKAQHLSLGNAQRLGLAKALVHNPEILILDEPSNGLDPAGIIEVRELIKHIALDQGVTVFISSHNLSEIAKTATRIGVIHKGRLVQEIDTDKLESVLIKRLIIDTRDRKGAAAYLKSAGYDVSFTRDKAIPNGDGASAVNRALSTPGDGAISISDESAYTAPEKLNVLLVNAGFPPHLLRIDQEDLEAYFIRLTGGTSC